MRNIVHHTYGEHEKCGEWCKAQTRPQYFFARLPHGKPLSCPQFRSDFEKLIEEKVNKAHMIAPGGTSQQNECFNHMAATRAPIGRHYAGTAANHFRVSSAVCRRNMGATYVNDVNKSAGLSPGGLTEKCRKSEEQRRRIKDLRQRLEGTKRRRLLLKNNSTTKSAANQRRDGLTYVGGMASTMDRAAAASTVTSWMSPSYAIDPASKPVVMDLETTGFGAQAEIVQIAAKCEGREFFRYILPSKDFNIHASLATALSLSDGHLMLRGSRVTTTPSQTVANEFLQFLKGCARQVILVGHNIVRFDAPILALWLKKHCLLEELCEITYAFTDTLPILKQGKVRKQEELARTYLEGPERQSIINGSHNAEIDVHILVGLLEHFNVGPEALRSAALSRRVFFERQAASRKKKEIIPGLSTLRTVISSATIGKMASQGLTIDELKREYQLHGAKGVEVCLGVQVNGKPRVTRNKKNIVTIGVSLKRYEICD